jgi:hypothetical protein
LLAAGYKGREGLFASMGQGNIFSGFINNRAAAENMIDRLKAKSIRTISSTELLLSVYKIHS